MANCKTCTHYEDCLDRFREAKINGFYELIDEEEYFAHADECDFFVGTAYLIKVPVKPGDTVYIINRGKIKEWKVYFVGINAEGNIKFTIADEGFQNTYEFWDFNIGVCVFLTEEDAINELKERKSYEQT